MNQDKPSPPSSSTKVEKTSPAKGEVDPVFAMASQIETMLSELTNKQAQKVIMMVGVLHGLKVQSSFAQTTPVVRAKSQKPVKTGSGDKREKLPCKRDPRWTQAQSNRSELVSKLKQSTDDSRADCIKSLDEFEFRMKELKSQLREEFGNKATWLDIVRLKPLSQSRPVLARKAKANRLEWYSHYYVKPPVTAVSGKTKSIGTRKRGLYFTSCRPERKILSLLEQQQFGFGSSFPKVNTPAEIKTRPINREIRILRKVYYTLLPRLFLFLWLQSDRHRLFEVEEIYYNWLNIANYIKGKGRGVNRLHVRFRPNPWLMDNQPTATAVAA